MSRQITLIATDEPGASAAMPDRRRLTSLLRRHYDIHATSIAPGERGTVAETYVVRTADSRYFAKLVPHSRYADGLATALPIHLALAEAGIDSIGRPIATQDGDLLVRLERHFLVVLDFLDGMWTEDFPFEPFVELMHSFRTRMGWLEEGLRLREAGEWPLDGQARPSAS